MLTLKTDKLSKEVLTSLRGLSRGEIIDTVEIADLVNGLDWSQWETSDTYCDEVLDIILKG